jgi:PhnB protein
MAVVNIYLSFDGNCENAFNFYKSIFGGEFYYISRYKDMPSPERPLSDQEKEKIMHVGLPVSKETILLGCDIFSETQGEKFVAGNNFSICVSAENEEEARRIFNALSEGGTITMPLDKSFWGALFGMLIDRFGVAWMVDYSLNQ